MLRTLLESNAPRERRRASTIASVAIHTAVIAGAIVATASATTNSSSSERHREPPPIYIPVQPAELTRTRPRSTPSGCATTCDMRLPRSLRDRPALVFRNDVTIPMSEIDPASLLARDQLSIDTGPIGGGRDSRRDVGPGGEPLTIDHVDRAAAALTVPRPRYPEQLRAAGVSGRVVVRFVVDTTGRVEASTVVVREAGHDLFAQSVRAVLPSLRFAPAEARGRKVRMLVDLPFEFRLHD